MYPDRRILRTYRRSEGISTRPYDQNTLTRQYDDTNDAPRDLCSTSPLHVLDVFYGGCISGFSGDRKSGGGEVTIFPVIVNVSKG